MTNLERLEKDIRAKLPRLKYIARPLDYPILLSDVLEWLGSKFRQSEYYFNIYGTLYVFKEVTWTNPDGYVMCRSGSSAVIWKLSSPYLRDQSQELIDYLSSLI